jgi:hypothetical protein
VALDGQRSAGDWAGGLQGSGPAARGRRGRGAEPAARVGRRRRPDAGGWDECVRGVVDGSVLEISFRAVFHWIGRLGADMFIYQLCIHTY